MSGQIQDPEAVTTFILGGNATFTLVSKKTGTRFTFKMQAPKGENKAGIRFVSVLVGADNWTNYKYVGFCRDGHFKHGGAKAKIGIEAPSVQAFAWFFGHLETCLDQMEFWHEGKCGRCARKLTVPESIATGLGPECAALMGVPWAKPQTSAQAELPGMTETAAA